MSEDVSSKPKAVMLITREMEAHCFAEEDLGRIAEATELVRAACDEMDDAGQVEQIRGAEIAITGWGSRGLSKEMLDAAPELKLVCHSAGSVRSLIDVEAFVERGIRACSARFALGTGVAEFAFGMMLVSMKAAWHMQAATQEGRWDREGSMAWVREPFGAVVGIVGASNVGLEMIRLCKTLELGAILVYDPFFSEEAAAAMGVEKVELDELMSRADVVSLHTPAIEATRHIVNGRNLALMKDNAIFINTARGMCVDEAALIAELEKGRLLACLDVTDPEPPEAGSPLYSLPNCILTPHIAGAIKENTHRQGRLVADQVVAFVAGEPMEGEIDLALHDRMA